MKKRLHQLLIFNPGFEKLFLQWELMSGQKKAYIILLAFFILSADLFAQNTYSFQQFFEEGKNLVTSPKNWNGSDWLKLGIILSASYGIMHADEAIRTEIQTNQQMRGTIPIEFGRKWGEPVASGLIVGFLLLHDAVTDNKKNRNTAFEIIQSQFYAGSVDQLLKIGFSRARPYMEKGAFDFSPVQIDDDFWSYPSGHTTMAFALSTTLAQNVNSDLMKIVCFIPAFMTAYARMYEDKHWASDVFVGAFLGYFTAKFFKDLHASKENIPSPENHTPLVNFRLPF